MTTLSLSLMTHFEIGNLIEEIKENKNKGANECFCQNQSLVFVIDLDFSYYLLQP